MHVDQEVETIAEINEGIDEVVLICHREFLTISHDGNLVKISDESCRKSETQEININGFNDYSPDGRYSGNWPKLSLSYTLPEREVTSSDGEPMFIASSVVTKELARMSAYEVRMAMEELGGVLERPLATHYPSGAPVREKYELK